MCAFMRQNITIYRWNNYTSMGNVEQKYDIYNNRGNIDNRWFFIGAGVLFLKTVPRSENRASATKMSGGSWDKHAFCWTKAKNGLRTRNVSRCT